jgi:quercetin 2,3-dioxygenase
VPRQDTPPEKIPKVPTPDGKGQVAVIAGEALGTKAVIETRSPMCATHSGARAGPRGPLNAR